MNWKIVLKRVLTGISAILIMFYLGYQVYLINYEPVTTETAFKYTIGNTADTKIFVIREEEYIRNSAVGTMVPLVEDGSRMAKGNSVSIVFNSDSDASTYSKLKSIEKDIEHYTLLKAQMSAYYVMDIDAINESITDKLEEYLKNIADRKYSKITEAGENFRDKATSLQIATGTYDFEIDSKLAELQNSYNETKAQMPSYTNITANKAGYYISSVDGYENLTPYNDVKALTCTDIDNLLSLQPNAIDSDIMGKIVSNFNWYIVCNVDSNAVANFKEGSNVTIRLTTSSNEEIDAVVTKINSQGDGRTALIMTCNDMNQKLANLRMEDAKVVLSEYTGYKINPQAIRVENEQKGVYVLRGNVITFRKVNIIYSEESFVLVDAIDGESGYIKMYDEVIVEGTELYDGKIIR